MKYGRKISLIVTYSLPRPSPLNLFHMLPVCFNVFRVFVCLLVCLSFPLHNDHKTTWHSNERASG